MSVVADGKQKHIYPFEEYDCCLICESTVGISGELIRPMGITV